MRLVEVAVSAGLKEPDPLPTAQANELCLSDSKSFKFIFSLATSKTVSETLSLLCSRTLKNNCGCCEQASPPDQPSVHTASGSVRELHIVHNTNLELSSIPKRGVPNTDIDRFLSLDFPLNFA